jgi:translation elongation factor EF-4
MFFKKFLVFYFQLHTTYDLEVLQIEPNTTYRKYKESAHMSLLDDPIRQPSVDISPIWTPVITAEVKKLQFRQV